MCDIHSDPRTQTCHTEIGGKEVKQQDLHLLNYLLQLIQHSKEHGIK